MPTLPANRKRFRMIVPAVPDAGIFSRFTRKITSLGAVLIATIVDKFLPNWTAEIIDENNYRKGPRDGAGAVDHEALQRDNPADAVGFYCGLSSTIPRVWRVAEYYRSQGVPTIAGGWHVTYEPEESLRNGLDIVVTGNGENAILDVLSSIEKGEIPHGIVTGSAIDLNSIPAPDFGLLRFSKVKIYPIGRIRGCSMKCEFCSVNEKPQWASPLCLFDMVKWLVETRQARSFFITDDRLEEDRDGYLHFFHRIAERYGKHLKFSVQVRLAAAEDLELIAAMKAAGVRHVCIGFESPIEEELRVMHKGIRVETMIEHARIWRKHFFVHGMFIFGYPMPQASNVACRQRIKQFKRFIRKSRIDSIQILRPVPLVGTRLRERLERNGQLFPLQTVGWEHYDGNYVCFKPANMTVQELQKGPTKIMWGFYHWFAKIRLVARTLTLPLYYPFTGWQVWYRGWWNDVVRTGGHRLLKRWRLEEKLFLKKILNLE